MSFQLLGVSWRAMGIIVRRHWVQLSCFSEKRAKKGRKALKSKKGKLFLLVDSVQ